MDTTLGLLIGGTILTLAAGVVSLLEKTTKMPQTPADEIPLKSEKRYAWYTFIFGVVLATILTFYSGCSSWSANMTEKAKADSTHKANDSLTHELLDAQHKFDSLAGLQLDSTTKSLKLAQQVISAQDKLNKSQEDLSSAQNLIASLQQESLNSLTGGKDIPNLIIASALPAVPDVYGKEYFVLTFYLHNPNKYPLHSINGSISDTENWYILARGIKHFIVTETMSNLKYLTQEEISKIKIDYQEYNFFNKPTLLPKRFTPIYIGTFSLVRAKEGDATYKFNLQWSNGVIDSEIVIGIKGKILSMKHVNLFLNGVKRPSKNIIQFKNQIND